MNARTFVSSLLASAFALVGPALAQSERADPLSISASHSNAGPYGDLWIAYLAPDGDLSVRASHRGSQAQTTSQYLPDRERVTLLRRAIDEAQFFDLRNELTPAVQHFHRPHYRLTVTLGKRQHSVAVSDPGEIGSTVEVKRFFLVWDALFSKLPVRPESPAAR